MPDNTANFYITADSSGFDSAVSSLNRLEQAADSVERKLAELEKRLLDVANAAKVAGNNHIGNMTAFGHAMNARFDNDPNNLPPNVQQAHQAYTQAQQQQDSQDQHQNQQSANQKTKQQTQSADGTEGGDSSSRYVRERAQDQSDRSFFMKIAETIGRTRTINAAGAFATGNSGPLVATMAQTVTQAVMGSKTLSGLYGKGMDSLRTHAFRALAPEAAGLEAAGIPQAGAASMGGMMNGAAVASMMPAIVGAVATAAVVGVVVANVVNALGAKQTTVEQSLRANVSGLGLSGPAAGNLRGDLMHITQNQFHYDKNIGFQVAAQMGRAGVSAQQMPDAMKLTLAMSRLTGMEPAQVGQLTSTMMVQGGKSIEGVKDAFLNMRDAAQKSGVSLTKMIDSLSSLQQATGGAAVNVASLASLQSALGPGINAGSLVSPMVGSFGVQSIVQSSLMGMSLGKFQTAQQDPMGLMKRASGMVHGWFGGKDTPMNEEIGATLLNNLGIVNTQGIPPNLMKPLMSSMISGNITDFKKASSQVSAFEKANPESGKSFEQQMSDLASGETPWITKMLQDLDSIVNDLTAMTLGIGKIVPGVENAIKWLWDQVANFFTSLFGGGSGNGKDGNNKAKDAAEVAAGVVNHDPAMVWAGIKGLLGIGGKDSSKSLTLPDSHGGDTSVVSASKIHTLLAAGKKYGVSGPLMLAIAGRESDYGLTSANVGQISPGVVGQAMKTKGSPLYGKSNAFAEANAYSNPKINAELQSWYLSYLTSTYKPTNAAQLAAMYNEGPGNYAKNGVNDYGKDVAKSEHTIEIILKNETGQELARKKTKIHTSHNPHRRARGESPHRAQQPPPRPGPPEL